MSASRKAVADRSIALLTNCDDENDYGAECSFAAGPPVPC